MQIKLSKKELKHLIIVMDSVEHNSSDNILKSLDNNKLISYCMHIDGSIDITIEQKYVEEFLELNSRYINLFASQGKALMHSVNLFKEEVEQINKKYIKPENKTSEEVCICQE